VKRALHLARRFVGSLSPAAPSPNDDAWARRVLGARQHALWARMPNHDRRHSVAVARRVERSLAGTEYAGDDRWLAAALLHDVGKLDARLGVFGRVGATLAGAAAGHDMAPVWSEKRGITRRVGLYLRHPELGAEHIRVAGGPDVVAQWAAAHHDRASWDATEIPVAVRAALHDADDD
jgi:HD domain-containing protein